MILTKAFIPKKESKRSNFYSKNFSAHKMSPISTSSVCKKANIGRYIKNESTEKK